MDSSAFNFPRFSEMPFLAQACLIAIVIALTVTCWAFWELIFWLLSFVRISVG